MIGAHLKERFFQRYYKELTPEILRELVALAIRAPSPGLPDPVRRDSFHLTVSWRGEAVKFVWCPRTRFIFTFLAPYMTTFTTAKKEKRR